MCSTSTVGASTLGASTLGGRRPRGSSNSLALDELRAVIALHSSEQEQEQQRAGLQGAPGEGGGPPPPQRVPSVDLCHRSQHSALQSPFSNLQDGEATELQRASSLRCNSGSASRASPRGAPGLVQPCADGASPHRRQLEKRCARALQLLERLQNPAHRQGSVFKEALPPAALRYAKVPLFPPSSLLPLPPSLRLAGRRRHRCWGPRSCQTPLSLLACRFCPAALPPTFAAAGPGVQRAAQGGGAAVLGLGERVRAQALCRRHLERPHLFAHALWQRGVHAGHADSRERQRAAGERPPLCRRVGRANAT